MTTTEWVLSLVIIIMALPASVGWYIVFRSYAARYLERHDRAQQLWARDQELAATAEATAKAIAERRTAYQRKRELQALGNGEIVTLTRSGPGRVA